MYGVYYFSFQLQINLGKLERNWEEDENKEE